MKADTQTHFHSICYWIDDLVCKATNCVLFAYIHHFYTSIKWDISIADISTLLMLISMMDISTAHISIMDISKMIYLEYIQLELNISFMDISMDISIILMYPCKMDISFIGYIHGYIGMYLDIPESWMYL